MKKFGVGLLGFGTVGGGVVDLLGRHGELISHRIGLGLEIRGIADLDIDSDRGVKVDRSLLTVDAAGLVDRADIDIVVELIGGVGPARELVLRALKQGKPVVTANKALLAEHGAELMAAARDSGADLYFEASVGGGIPVIRSLREGLVGNHIDAIYGILNGTCNYMLTEMEQNLLSFEEALEKAQQAGYAEVDPTLDIEGWDTAHKAVILASLAYGRMITMDSIVVEGITALDKIDVCFARELGYAVKLLAVIRHWDDQIEVGVHPALIPEDSMLAAVGGAFNAVLVRGDVVGDTLYYGQGAGRDATASAVVGDLADVARNLQWGAGGRVPALVEHGHYGEQHLLDDIRVRYYLRLTLCDKPGVFARVADILGRHGISIASIVQKEEVSDNLVPVIILTQMARERDFREALMEIDSLAESGAPPVRVRIESCD